MVNLQPICTFSGAVIHGQGKGHTVGMPTANLPCPPGKNHPPFGVYASLVQVEKREYVGVTNVGSRPSVTSDPEPTVETLLLGFQGDLYGKEIAVTLYAFLRPIQKMASLEEVKSQVQKDGERALALLGNR